jgi:hypothetical protein
MGQVIERIALEKRPSNRFFCEKDRKTPMKVFLMRVPLLILVPSAAMINNIQLFPT